MKIFVCNSDLSGLNKYLICELEKRGHKIISAVLPNYNFIRILALLMSFGLDFRKWRTKTSENLDRLHKTYFMFKKKSVFFRNNIEKHDDVDIILQFSGMFMPSDRIEELRKPYIIYTDYTVKLARKYSLWLPFNNQIECWYRLEKKLYDNARIIFTLSENTKMSVINDYGIEPQKVCNAGCGFTFDSLDYCLKSYTTPNILFVGLDFARKGGPVLIDAFKTVRKAFPNAQLIIAGPSKTKLKISEPGINLVGKVSDRNKLRELYKAASLFVLPSLCEPFGLVFLEAMSYRLPCIGANTDAIAEIIDDGITGFIVPPNNPDALAGRMIELLKNIDLMRAMGEAGHKKLMDNFIWEKVVDKMESFLRIHQLISS